MPSPSRAKLIRRTDNKGGGVQTEELCYRFDAAGHRLTNLRAVVLTVILVPQDPINTLKTHERLCRYRADLLDLRLSPLVLTP